MAVTRKPPSSRQDEFELIERHFVRDSKGRGVVLGIGDDAAVVETGATTAVATDTLVAGVHFPDDLAGDAVGHRALAVNLSDLAAMGARPRWCTLALTMPGADRDWLESFAAGVLRAGRGARRRTRRRRHHPRPLVGHRAPAGRRGQDPDAHPRRRRSGRRHPRDRQSGRWRGGPAARPVRRSRGWRLATGAARKVSETPAARIGGSGPAGESQAPPSTSRTGCLPTSGIFAKRADAPPTSMWSGCPHRPRARDLFSPEEVENWALSGGDDYELCFTSPPSSRRAVQRALASCRTPFRRIGRLRAGSGVQCRRSGQPMVPAGAAGYAHFGDA